MPRGDRTGPDGQGPRTGRGLGYCSGYDSPGFTKGIPRGGAGVGRGFGRGRGFGFRNLAPQTAPRELTKAEEKKILEANLESLKQEIKEAEKRLKELK
ncbi:hypothetical protein DRN73_03180 [Candidatus Pacearchaeota archaeon]|nr:MAG: hypothetical protein DRN73_03180 [Candidatus Pacearchaeota archaeon]